MLQPSWEAFQYTHDCIRYYFQKAHRSQKTHTCISSSLVGQIQFSYFHQLNTNVLINTTLIWVKDWLKTFAIVREDTHTPVGWLMCLNLTKKGTSAGCTHNSLF